MNHFDDSSSNKCLRLLNRAWARYSQKLQPSRSKWLNNMLPKKIKSILSKFKDSIHIAVWTNLYNPVFINKKIGRLQISMDNSRMTCVQIIHSPSLHLSKMYQRFKKIELHNKKNKFVKQYLTWYHIKSHFHSLLFIDLRARSMQ